ncbi:MAG TPA: helix-turn-helix domain-containing protein [bacterium]|jgi:transcriptional regulator with XRE-family HTH domain|nr:helix-turn-helix domain-containing protein [bacterium]
MPFFNKTPILLDEETLAEQLRRRRQASGLKLEEASKRLKIKVAYLDALEKGRYDLLPSGVYGRNFLREYASFLGLDSRQLLTQFSREVRVKSTSKGELFDRQVVSKRYLLALPQLLRNAIIGVLIVACLIYLSFLLKRIFEPPFLVINFPPDNFTTSDIRLVINGQSEAETEITINGQGVLADNQGKFEREIYLQSGINRITVVSEKKYSRPATVTKQVLVK